MSLKFTKSYLKEGMVVETRNKERYIFCNNRFMSVEDTHTTISLFLYNDDLLLSNNGKKCDGDIVKIFLPVKFLSEVNTTEEIIWQRGVNVHITKHVTVDELEQFFGCKIEILKE